MKTIDELKEELYNCTIKDIDSFKRSICSASKGSYEEEDGIKSNENSHYSLEEKINQLKNSIK